MWKKDKTSLGEYFINLKKTCKRPIKGGFWNPIEMVFNIERCSLRHVVSVNGRGITIKESNDYEKIKELLINRWKNKIGKCGEKKHLTILSDIKKIIEETDNKNCYNVIQSLNRIKSLLE